MTDRAKQGDSLTGVLWTSPRPSANGRYWRIWSHGHVEVLPKRWKPGQRNPADSWWPTDTPANRAKAAMIG